MRGSERLVHVGRLTVVFGGLLVVIGIVGFVMTGHIHYTALIPALFGLLLIVCGTAAQTPNDKQRMLWMHIAVTVGLLGFLFTAKAIFQTIEVFQGIVLARPAAAEAKAAMSVVCLVFTLLCVRSFIAARRLRRA
jgi:hypothetical protein